MEEKRLVLLHGEIVSPPFSIEARREAGFLLRQLQSGDMLAMPDSRPMPSIGPRCHELRIRDQDFYWRIIYRIDQGEILVAEVFAKKTRATPALVINNCRSRFASHDERELQQRERYSGNRK
jgi:phage-related protein